MKWLPYFETGSRRSTFCIGAFGRRSMNCDLFVLTVLRIASSGLLLGTKGGDLSPNRTRQHPHETPPTSPPWGAMLWLGIFVLVELLVFFCESKLLSGFSDQRNQRRP